MGRKKKKIEKKEKGGKKKKEKKGGGREKEKLSLKKGKASGVCVREGEKDGKLIIQQAGSLSVINHAASHKQERSWDLHMGGEGNVHYWPTSSFLYISANPSFFLFFSFLSPSPPRLKVQIYLRSSYKTLEDEKSCSQARQCLVQLIHYKLYLSWLLIWSPCDRVSERQAIPSQIMP